MSRHYNPAICQLKKAYDLAKEKGAPQDVIDAMKEALDLSQFRDDFCESSTSSESAECKNIYDQTMTNDWQKLKEEGKTIWELTPVMMTGPLEGQFLKSLVSIQNAKRVLDIGMFTGYSALSMAEALPADGELVTVDQDPFLEGYTKDLLQKSPHGKKITIIIGGGTKIMKDLAEKGQQFDIIFLDADKSEYVDYLKIAFDSGLLKARGSVLVDNAFQRGRAYIPSMGDTSAKRFAAAVAARTDIHKSLVPLRDGIDILRRLSDVEGAAQ